MGGVTIDTKETTLNPFVSPAPVELPEHLAAPLASAKHLAEESVPQSVRYLRSEVYKVRGQYMSAVAVPGVLERAVKLDAAYQTYTRLLDTIRDEEEDPGLYGSPYLVELAAVADALAHQGGVPVNLAARLGHLRDVPVPLADEVPA